MFKTSEVIKALQGMQETYGDLPFSMSCHFEISKLNKEQDKVVLNFEQLYFGYDQFNDKSDEINIRTFPY